MQAVPVTRGGAMPLQPLRRRRNKHPNQSRVRPRLEASAPGRSRKPGHL